MDITRKNLHIFQLRNCQCYSYNILWYYWWINKGRLCLGHVTSSYNLVFTTEVIYHIDIKYDVTAHLLTPRQKFLHFTLINLERKIIILIYCTIASYNIVLPFTLSSDILSFTDLGILNIYLWVQSQYFNFNFETILFLFFITCGTHHYNGGYWEMHPW